MTQAPPQYVDQHLKRKAQFSNRDSGGMLRTRWKDTNNEGSEIGGASS